MDYTLLIMAAGMGSRFGGLKQLHPFGQDGEVLLDYAVFDALKAGFNRFIFVIRPDFEEEFKKHITDRLPSHVQYVLSHQVLEDIPFHPTIFNQRKKPWGTAHAVWAAREQLKGPFAVINADDFYGRDTFKQLIHFFKSNPPSNHQACVTFPLRKTLSIHGSVSRGVCTLNENREIQSVTEHTQISLRKDGSIVQDEGTHAPFGFKGDEQVSVNCWGFDVSFLTIIEKALDEFLKKPNLSEKDEFLLPRVVNDYIAKKEIVVQSLPSTSEWAGVTYREDVDWVKSIIARYTLEGLYPKQLWRNESLSVC